MCLPNLYKGNIFYIIKGNMTKIADILVKNKTVTLQTEKRKECWLYKFILNIVLEISPWAMKARKGNKKSFKLERKKWKCLFVDDTILCIRNVKDYTYILTQNML